VEQALDAIDYTLYDQYKGHYTPESNQPVSLAHCDYFCTQHLQIDQPIHRDYRELDSFVVYVCVGGSLTLSFEGGEVAMHMGQAFLLPASLKTITLRPQGEAILLESFVP
jgi:mannose-6-phosphate isomerase